MDFQLWSGGTEVLRSVWCPLILLVKSRSTYVSPTSHVGISSKLPRRLPGFLVEAVHCLAVLVACCRKRRSSWVGILSSVEREKDTMTYVE